MKVIAVVMAVMAGVLNAVEVMLAQWRWWCPRRGQGEGVSVEARLDTIYFTLCGSGRDECGKSPQWMVCISFREEKEEEKE
ncbi:hypothetical protein E2C01_015594 [Portunus trituberculatus]|uniref:Secreted protein n=1 Tax=Portunus trituberculatus TaxID=210409 RepID=A0A5B7DN79_PORTR|nr:hypothetical protein [Portunus trituberculatus]